MANMILPVKLGEIVRAVVLGQREQIDKSASFATVVVDRLLMASRFFHPPYPAHACASAL
jgi:hypothetical protein